MYKQFTTCVSSLYKATKIFSPTHWNIDSKDWDLYARGFQSLEFNTQPVEGSNSPVLRVV